MGFCQPNHRSEPVSVILNLQEVDEFTRRVYELELEDKNLYLTQNLERIRKLDNNFSVGINLTNLMMFEKNKIETMVYDALTGFNLCLVIMGKDHEHFTEATKLE